MGFKNNKKKLEDSKFRKLSKEDKKEIRNFWSKYKKKPRYLWNSYYSYSSGIESAQYIPDSLYYSEILKALNNQEMGAGLSDKNIYDLLFDTKQPNTIARKQNGILLSRNYEKTDIVSVINNCVEIGNVVIKPTLGTYGGEGIKFWNDSNDISQLEEILSQNSDFIVQTKVKQHKFYNNIDKSSLNTVRIVTLLLDQEPIVLSSILRMGKGGSKVDNFSAGGIIVPVDKNGKCYDKAVQSDQSILEKHPDGFVFKNQYIHGYDKMVSEAKKLHFVIPYFKMISWDFAIDEYDEVVLIEGNYPSGQLDLHQLNIGPIFGEYTEKVLDYVYKSN